ncbi:MAG: hypothetical protein KC910_34260, partial [Candidatus Eremiobacteraeota bacterium]|nr:hypothetical protein [Candidatus Eremiobacteraeota bacterium]
EVVERLDLAQASGDLRVRIEVRSQGFGGVHTVWLQAGAFDQFLVTLDDLERSRRGEAVLVSLSDEEFRLRLFARDPAGHIQADGYLTQADGRRPKDHWSRIGFALEVEPTTLSQLAKDFRAEVLRPSAVANDPLQFRFRVRAVPTDYRCRTDCMMVEGDLELYGPDGWLLGYRYFPLVECAITVQNWLNELWMGHRQQTMYHDSFAEPGMVLTFEYGPEAWTCRTKWERCQVQLEPLMRACQGFIGELRDHLFDRHGIEIFGPQGWGRWLGPNNDECYTAFALAHLEQMRTGSPLLHNLLLVPAVCGHCHRRVEMELQFRFGANRASRYRIGDTIEWGQALATVGEPGMGRVSVEGRVRSCPACNQNVVEAEEYDILITQDVIESIEPRDGRSEFLSQHCFTILEP